MESGVCPECGKIFHYYLSEYRGKKKTYCSKECYRKNYVPWNLGKIEKRTCIGCGKVVRKWRKYCSSKCYYEHVDVSLRLPKSLKGNLNPNFGKKYSEERIKQMSEYGKKHPVRFWLGKKRDFSGENHWNWKGGKKKRPWTCSEYALWRRSVFERDEYRCQDCGVIHTALNAHHIKRWVDFPELRYAIDNGVTLCVKCHYMRHRKK